MKKYIFFFAFVMMMASCATQKKVVDKDTATTVVSGESVALQKLNYVRKVTDNAAYTQNIVSKIDLDIDAMGKTISVDGKIYMRKNEVIRIVISPFGLMEVGRLEFAPDYVLVLDRVNKQYVKAKYSDLDFLSNNGLDFYSLQALFWNQLFLPNTAKLTDASLKNFDVDLQAKADRKVTMKSKDLTFTWNTAPETARINAAQVDYAKGTTNASTASWEYSNFTALGKKQFPLSQVMSFASKQVQGGKKLTMGIKMKKISSDSDWDAKTSVSGKYTEVKAEDVLGKLLSM